MKRQTLPVWIAAFAVALMLAVPTFQVPALADDDDDAVTHVEINDSGVTVTDEEGARSMTWDEVLDQEEIGEDMVRIGSDVHIPENTVLEGNAVAVMGNVRIDGYVEGDAVAVGGDLIVGPNARIDGDAVSVGGQVKREGGLVRGETVSIGFASGWNKGPGFFLGSFFSAGRRLLLIVMWILVLIALGALLIAVLRRPVDIVSARVAREAFFNGLIGLLAWALLIPVIVLLVITVIGIPIAVLVPFIFAIMMLLGFIGVSVAAGQRFAGGPNGSAFKGMAIGILVLYALVLLGAILRLGPGPVHFAGSIIAFIGWAVVFVATTVGLGAVVTSRFGTREKRPKVMPAATLSSDRPAGEAS